MFAASRGDVATVQLLLEYGAEHTVNENGESPYTIALSHNHYDAAWLLLADTRILRNTSATATLGPLTQCKDSCGSSISCEKTCASCLDSVPSVSWYTLNALYVWWIAAACIVCFIGITVTATLCSSNNAEKCCCVCLEVLSTHAFVPCGHVCVCANHAKVVMLERKKTPQHVARCPICRNVASNCVEVYF